MGAINGISPLLVWGVLVAGLGVFVVAVVRYVRLRAAGWRG
ncbi:hypothetical protein [Saccharopolyspora flava]|nr:hypothetical protein [Saccharopolyspora flava]